MADTKISALPAVIAVTAADEFPLNQTGVTKKATLGQVAGLVAPPPITRSFGITIDGGGAPITTGVKGYIPVPYSCTILSWVLLSTDGTGPIAGSIVVDLWKAAFSAYPPTVANSITGSAKPTLSSAHHAQSSSLTGWTTAVTAGDVIGVNVVSITGVTRAVLQLVVQ